MRGSAGIEGRWTGFLSAYPRCVHRLLHPFAAPSQHIHPHPHIYSHPSTRCFGHDIQSCNVACTNVQPGRQALSALLTPLDASLLTDARRRLPLKHDGISILHDSPSPSRWLRSRSKSKSGARLAFSGVCAPYESCMVERSDLVRILKEALRGRGVEVEGGVWVRGLLLLAAGVVLYFVTAAARRGVSRTGATGAR